MSTGKYLRATLLCNEVFSSRHLWTSAWCAEASDDSEPFDVGIVGQYSSCTAGSEMVWSDGMHFEAKSTDHLLILVNCCERLEAGCEKADRKEAARQRISASDVLCFDTCSERFWQHVMSHVMSSVYVHLCLYVFTCLHVFTSYHISYHNQIKSYHIISCILFKFTEGCPVKDIATTQPQQTQAWHVVRHASWWTIKPACNSRRHHLAFGRACWILCKIKGL